MYSFISWLYLLCWCRFVKATSPRLSLGITVALVLIPPTVLLDGLAYSARFFKLSSAATNCICWVASWLLPTHPLKIHTHTHHLSHISVFSILLAVGCMGATVWTGSALWHSSRQELPHIPHLLQQETEDQTGRPIAPVNSFYSNPCPTVVSLAILLFLCAHFIK